MPFPTVLLKPVFSAPAKDLPAGLKLPEDWLLSWHQAETFQALRDSNVDVVINTAMTGDGKSLAAFLETMQGDGCYAIGLYPTNELGRDQARQVQSYVELFKPENEPRVNRLNGPELEIYAETENLSKAGAIANRSSNSEILITNPDIFHYLHRGAYLSPKDSPDKLWNRIDKNFDLFIFDEFHVFLAPQIAGVLNTMLLMRATNREKKFLFLSATPNEQFVAALEAAGFRCQLIDPERENKYASPQSGTEAQALIEQRYRQVARAIELKFVPLEPAAKASETWLKQAGEQVLQQYLEHPGTKGAMILNSIAAVKRLVPFFRGLFEPCGLTVRENTGLTGKSEKAESLGADLVIGTSTIDVGVDFRINYLIFESSDAGNFIQRLGRLGRHDKSETGAVFDGFTAYALVPNFLAERLFEGEGRLLEDGGECDRFTLNRTIQDCYQRVNDFRGYYRRWGSVQALTLLYQLNNPKVRSQYAGSRDRFAQEAEQVFGVSPSKVASRVKAWAKDWQRQSGQQGGNPIAEEASSFRGASGLLCGLYDLTEPKEADRFKTYDLPGVLSNLEIEPWTERGFLAELEQVAKRSGQTIPKGRFNYCLGFMKLRAYRAERLNWKFHFPRALDGVADAWKVQVLDGLEVWQPENRWVDGINQRLRKQALVAYVLKRPVGEVKRRLRLPMHFQLYPISDERSIHDATAPYAVAFGQAALLLDTLAYTFKSEGGEGWIV
jgi:CRISPR-associated endonuclease/helicase Cas3